MNGPLKTILVVESDHQTRVLVRKILEEAGHFVISAANGASGLEILSRMTKPAMILVATEMPLISGRAFLEHLAKDPNYSSIPISQIAGPGDDVFPEACHTVLKPVTRDNLLEAIKKC